jgi:hypothetical protein
MSDGQTIFRTGKSHTGYSILLQTGYQMKDPCTLIYSFSGKMINIYSM